LTSLVAPVLGYEILAPQDTLEIKALEVSSCRIFFAGYFLGQFLLSTAFHPETQVQI